MIMYLKSNDFNLKKNKLQIESTDNIVLVCVFSTVCAACNNEKTHNLRDVIEFFPEISFAQINIDKQFQLNDTLKSAGIHLTHVPSYLLFKLGIFERQLELQTLSKSEIQRELHYELDPVNIIPKNSDSLKYITMDKL